ncbi:Protein YigP (COG3165) clustered with ubiquinone biosynthetic genes [plant metagenome]|uniref:Protein YigP (COG3165) clustered with ubiquinone biosynthetic genes n=1 Tax=plant metagenome TaxID=1297885 RepID=A0A484R2C9_9ZZZZ
MLPAFLPPPARLAARAINAVLAREPWARERLARHAGKTVRFTLGGFALALSVEAAGTVVPAAADASIDVTLGVVPERVTLARLLPGAGGDAIADMTHISGDAALAQVVGDLARQLRPDPEDELARWIGDAPAVRVVAGCKALFSSARVAGERLTGNVAEYLSEENRMLVGQPEWQTWRRDLADTQAALDAGAARLAALQARVARLTAARG